MKSELLNLTNIGESSVIKLNQIGIYTLEEFYNKDPYLIFEEMLKFNPTLPHPMLSSLVGANSNIPWFEINEVCKKEFEKYHPNYKWLKYHK